MNTHVTCCLAVLPVRHSCRLRLLHQQQDILSTARRRDSSCGCHPPSLTSDSVWCCPCCSCGRHLSTLMLQSLLCCPCCRYSSYGRHFTKEDRLKTVARKLATFLQNGDLVRQQPVVASCMPASLHPCTQQSGGERRGEGLPVKGA